jgi:hypothetical protein
VDTVDLVRVDFALIPDDPLFGAVITASQAITDASERIQGRGGSGLTRTR